MSSPVSLSILDSKICHSLGSLLTKGCTAEGGACFPPGTAQPVQCQVSSTAWQPPASAVGFDQIEGLTAHTGVLSSAFKPAGHSVNSTDSGTG